MYICFLWLSMQQAGTRPVVLAVNILYVSEVQLAVQQNATLSIWTSLCRIPCTVFYHQRTIAIIHVCFVMRNDFFSPDVNFVGCERLPGCVCTCLGPPQAITTSPGSLARDQQDIREGRRQKERQRRKKACHCIVITLFINKK